MYSLVNQTAPHLMHAGGGDKPFHRYRIHQLVVDSDIELPCDSINHNGKSPDLLVTRGELTADMFAKADAGDEFVGVIPDVSRFYLSSDRSIVYDPMNGVSEAQLAQYLSGEILAISLRQRGLFVLHGSAITIGDQCAIFVGASGAGKSTTAFTFFNAGHRVLVDDVAPLEIRPSGVFTTSGVRRLKLREEVIAGTPQYGILEQIDDGSSKYQLPIKDGADGSYRVAYIVQLRIGTDLKMKSLTPIDAYQVLQSHSRGVPPLTNPNYVRRSFEQASQIVQKVKVMDLWRPRDMSRLGEMVSYVRGWVEEHSA